MNLHWFKKCRNIAQHSEREGENIRLHGAHAHVCVELGEGNTVPHRVGSVMTAEHSLEGACFHLLKVMCSGTNLLYSEPINHNSPQQNGLSAVLEAMNVTMFVLDSISKK